MNCMIVSKIFVNGTRIIAAAIMHTSNEYHWKLEALEIRIIENSKRLCWLKYHYQQSQHSNSSGFSINLTEISRL